MKKFKIGKEKGITLISLVVAIIVLLILAGVSLSLVLGEEGIIGRANGSREQYEIEQDKEIINIALATAQMSADYKNYNAENIQEALAGQNIENVQQRGNNISLTLNGRDYRIKPNGEVIEYTYMDTPTDIYWKLDNGILYLRSTENTDYTKGMNWYSSRADIIQVEIEENIAPSTARNMFYGCVNLTNIINLGKLHTENVKDMRWMFGECSNLQELDLSVFETSNVEDMESMFNSAKKLEELDLKSFNTENVKNMNNIFYGCVGLNSIDLSSFETRNVENMAQMFRSCSNLKEIDISSFTTESCTNTVGMFGWCSNLKTIYASDLFNLNNEVSTSNTFIACPKLVGGKGTKVTDINATYARIDNPPDAPGYFTLKP